MKTSIRSSSRTKAEPAYYQKIINRLTPKRDELLNAAEAAGDVYLTDRDSDERRQADKMTAKIRWASLQHTVANNMVRDGIS